jgi:hypothetical protein
MGNNKYIVAFLITAVIFGTAVLTSNYLSQKKLDSVKVMADRVALDILSNETQYALLEETPCSNFGTNLFSQEIGTLGEKLAFAENNADFDSNDLAALKHSYFLWEIKDYLLSKQIATKCAIKSFSILYFYSDKESCPDCEKMGMVLTDLRNKYPSLRVYSFDYNFDVGAIKTLISLYKVKDELPALVVNGKVRYGFATLSELEKSVPGLSKLPTSVPASTATKPAS